MGFQRNVAFLVMGMASLVLGGIISSSDYSHCINDGSEPITCQEKIVIALSLDNSQGPTETVRAYLEKVESSGVTLTLSEPLLISMKASPIYARYKLEYLKNFNSQPYEEVVIVDLFPLFEVCEDDDDDTNPTCGWYLDENAEKVPDSQGFCCSCIWSITDDTRAGKSCDLMTLYGGYFSSGHCLRFGNIWYASYSIKEAEVFYDITVEISSNSSGLLTEQLIISPEIPSAKSTNGLLNVELIGQVRSGPELMELSNYLLMAPTEPTDHARVTAGVTYWMLMEKEKVDETGLTCNKIGASFEAFRNEINACEKDVGSCFRYQLEHYHQEDLQRVSSGIMPKYFLSGFGDFVPVPSGVYGPEYYLMYEYTSLASTLLTLTLKADHIDFVVNRSPGKFVTAYVEQFESLSSQGKLIAVVQNTGVIISDYTVTVTECSQYIAPVIAQTYSIVEAAEHTFEFDIHAETTIGSEFKCTASLLDSDFSYLDSVVVHFNTTSTPLDFGDQGGLEPIIDGEIIPFDWNFLEMPALLQCAVLCPNIFNVPCFVRYSCWGNVLSFVVFVVILFVIVIIILILIRCIGPKNIVSFGASMINPALGASLRAALGFRLMSPSRKTHVDDYEKRLETLLKKIESAEKNMRFSDLENYAEEKFESIQRRAKTLDIEKINKIAKRGGFLYFNIVSKSKIEYFVGNIRRCSLLGRLLPILDPSFPSNYEFTFIIDPDHSQQLFTVKNGRRVRLEVPEYLPDELCQTHLTAGDVLRRCSIEPKYVRLN